MNKNSALIVGASGLVGGFCLSNLLASDSYIKVIVLVRKPLPTTHPKLEQHVVDSDNLQQSSQLIKADDVFCTLGTTIRKAGSQEAFEKVDYTYPVEVAGFAVANGAKQFLIVTAIGANASSSVFYNRVKGKVEEAIKALPFRSVHIFQPSFLLGERTEKRTGEKLGILLTRALSPLLVGGLRKYRGIEARVVASVMVTAASKEQSGIHIYRSDMIQNIFDGESKK